jgi:hypothetical protein
MDVQFEWQVGTEDGDWETLAKTERRAWFRWLRRVRWWTWLIAAVILLSVVAGGYFLLRSRYEQLSREIEFQIQGVIDLEAQAFARGDVGLFLEQQDPAAPDWVALQRKRIMGECDCDPVLPAQIQDVALHRDVAWVQVIEGESEVRRVRFYRQTEQGWRQTAPRVEFWGAPIELHYGEQIYRYHVRDGPYVDPLIEQIQKTVDQVCGTLECPGLADMVVVFSIDALPGQAPALRDNLLVIASPWISGLPPDGKWSDQDLHTLAYQVSYQLTARALRAAVSRDLEPLYLALIDEYAAWCARGDAAQAPILRRVIDMRGTQVLASMFATLPMTHTLSTFLNKWLLLSPLGHEKAYFETLLNIEREAINLGYRDTFLLLQDAQTSWQNRQELYYETMQQNNLTAAPVVVQSVEMNGRRARVTVRGPTVELQDGFPRTIDVLVFFRFSDGDWKHTSLVYAPRDSDTLPATPFQAGRSRTGIAGQ